MREGFAVAFGHQKRERYRATESDGGEYQEDDPKAEGWMRNPVHDGPATSPTANAVAKRSMRSRQQIG